MAPWLIPTLKVVLPHLGTIISVAKPVFTRKRAAAAAEQPALAQQQIDELQAAVSQNAVHIRELAAALEQAAALTDAKLRRTFLLCVIGAALSLVSFGLALTVFLAK